jgi:hypothetical protein
MSHFLPSSPCPSFPLFHSHSSQLFNWPSHSPLRVRIYGLTTRSNANLRLSTASAGEPSELWGPMRIRLKARCGGRALLVLLSWWLESWRSCICIQVIVYVSSLCVIVSGGATVVRSLLGSVPATSYINEGTVERPDWRHSIINPYTLKRMVSLDDAVQ